MSIVEAEHPAGVPVSVSVEIGGKEISFETGKIAKQADGAVLVRSGETVVLGTAQGRTEAREGADFFPLTVDVEERMYAAGKIPGGFFKREGRPTERAILTARMIDRPVRPLWPKGYRNETQCVATVFSADMVTAHDILCDQRSLGGADRVAAAVPRPDRRRADGHHRRQPRRQPDAPGDSKTSDLDLIVVGTKDGLTMVEAGAKQVHEDKLLEALEIAQREIVKLCDAQLELRAKEGKTKWLDPAVTERLEAAYGHEIWARIQQQGLREAAAIVEEIVEKEVGARSRWTRRGEGLRRAAGPDVAGADPREAALRRRRGARPREVRERPAGAHRRRAGLEGAQVGEAQPALRAHHREGRAAVPGRRGHRRRRARVKDSLTKSYVKKACESIYKSLVRQKIAVDKRRPDGRTATQIRPIEVEVGGHARAPTARGSSPAARRRSCRC